MIPQTSHLWRADDPVSFYSRLATMVGLQLTLLSTVLILMGYQNEIDARRLGEELRRSRPEDRVELLKASEFYSQFRDHVQRSQHLVRICYFAPYPPSEVKDKEWHAYYEEALDLMKKRQNVAFKRIIRSSQRNEPWIASLVQELRNRGNNDIAILGDLPESDAMPLALSVQIIDETDCWIVAIASHENEGVYRDVHLASTRATKAINDYFERLWSKSVKLLDRGRITEEGERLISRMARKDADS
jgi:hypothetical protein